MKHGDPLSSLSKVNAVLYKTKKLENKKQYETARSNNTKLHKIKITPGPLL